MEDKTVTTLDQEVQKNTSIIVTKAAELAVDTQSDYDIALSMGKSISGLKKQVDDYFNPAVSLAHQAHKAIKTKHNEALKPLLDAREIIKDKMTVFSREQQKIQQEAEEKARKKAEAVAAVERKRLEEEAEAAAAAGKTEEFEQKSYEAEQVQTTPISTPAPKQKGSMQNWQFRVVNKRTLLKAALEDDNLLQAVIPNDRWLGQMAKINKGQMKIPGVEFFDKGTVRFG